MTAQPGAPIPVPENFPFTWQDPQDKTLTWHREYTHCPEAMPALGGDFWRTVWNGMDRSREYSGDPHQPLLRWINNYIYIGARLTIEPDEEEAANKRAEELRGIFGEKIQAHWQDEILPKIQGHLDRWDSFDLEAATTRQLRSHVAKTWDWLLEIWTLHFRLNASHGRKAFTDYYKELFGEGADLDIVRRMVQGLPTKTTAMGQALWDLSRLVPAEFAETIADENRAVLKRSAEGTDFLVKLDEFLAAYGHRGNHWGLQYPTWVEDPSPVLNMLCGYRSADHNPEAAFAAQTAEREQTLNEVRTQLRGYPQAARDRFEKLLGLAHVSEQLREDHNFWIDYSCTSRVRRIMLAAGCHLARAGIVRSHEEVFHLHIDEVLAALADEADVNHRLQIEQRIEHRQNRLKKFSSIEPPARLGVEPKPDETESDIPKQPLPPDEPGLLRGQAAAPGIALGRARVVNTLTGAQPLASGEILVTRSTGPSFTPLFAIAGGLITETGGPLCHCAVIAREYRIASVILADARQHIGNGQLIEVDGDAGTVRLVE